MGSLPLLLTTPDAELVKITLTSEKAWANHWSFEEKTFVKQSMMSEWEKCALKLRFALTMLPRGVKHSVLNMNAIEWEQSVVNMNAIVRAKCSKHECYSESKA